MSAFSELLVSSFPDGWSNREVARRADDLGVKLSRATVDKYTQRTHGRPNEPTIRAFHQVLGIPLQKLRMAAKVHIGETEAWSPPPEADRMTARQRKAVDELIRSMVSGAEQPTLTEKQRGDQYVAILAQIAKLGSDVMDAVFDAGAWARTNGISRDDFNDRIVQLLRRGDVSSTEQVIEAMRDLLPAPQSGFDLAARDVGRSEGRRIRDEQDRAAETAGSDVLDTREAD